MTTLSDAPAAALKSEGPNVEGAEKWISIAGGGALAAFGLKRGGVLGLVSALVGGGLVARGVTGQCPAKRMFVGGNVAERKVAKDMGWSSAKVVQKSVTIIKPGREELYTFWRDFSNLATFMENIQSIEVKDERHSHWVVKAPAGRTVEWDAVVTVDEPGRRIAWTSAEGASVKNAGQVEFRDAAHGRGTEVRAHILYEPPAGELGKLIAVLFQMEPGMQAHRDLRRFKMLMETGEISTTESMDAAPRFEKNAAAKAA